MVRFFFYHSWQDDAVQDMKCFWCLFANYLRLFIVLSGGEDFMSSPQLSAWICKAQEVLGTSVVLPHRWTICKAYSPLCPPQSSAPECLLTANWISGQLVKEGQEWCLWMCALGGVLVHKLLLVVPVTAQSKFFPHPCRKAVHTSPPWRVLPLTASSVMQISFWISDIRYQLMSPIQIYSILPVNNEKRFSVLLTGHLNAPRV